MVTLRNAAAAGDMGIVHPLLRRFQSGAASMIVFGLPAVLVSRCACIGLYSRDPCIAKVPYNRSCCPRWCPAMNAYDR